MPGGLQGPLLRLPFLVYPTHRDPESASPCPPRAFRRGALPGGSQFCPVSGSTESPSVFSPALPSQARVALCSRGAQGCPRGGGGKPSGPGDFHPESDSLWLLVQWSAPS